jgi:UDP-2,3-diacylglucosamine hydrolase
MSPTLFISDLHLSAARPKLVEAFLVFARNVARGATTLYVLGDLFDAWIGDDQLKEPFAASVADALASLTAGGTAIYMQRGNRDFLLGERFTLKTGATLLPDMVVHDVAGTPTLLLHGDLLCTDDHAYQRYRARMFDPARQRRLLALPYIARQGIAAYLRWRSRRATAGKPEFIMDVNSAAVADAFRAHAVLRMIHGHTHRPARHEHRVDGAVGERWVLPDWRDRACYIDVDASGVHPRELPP